MLESRAYDKPTDPAWPDDPVVVVVATGTHDVSRLVNLLRTGNSEQADLGDQVRRQLSRNHSGRAALTLLHKHGGPELLVRVTRDWGALRDTIRLAISDPHSILERRTGPEGANEPITTWSARAVMAVIEHHPGLLEVPPVPDGLVVSPPTVRFELRCGHCEKPHEGEFGPTTWSIEALRDLSNYGLEDDGWELQVDGKAAICGDCAAYAWCEGCGDPIRPWRPHETVPSPNASKEHPDLKETWHPECWEKEKADLATGEVTVQ